MLRYKQCNYASTVLIYLTRQCSLGVELGDVTHQKVTVVQKLCSLLLFTILTFRWQQWYRVTALPIELIQSQQMVQLAASSLQISLKLLVCGSGSSRWSTLGRLIWKLASVPPFKGILATNIELLAAFANVCNIGSFPQLMFSFNGSLTHSNRGKQCI